ncbi:MAG: glutamine synthetase family protein [Asticcacaulis sp.]|uniref:glutamine synthetase family protein n=1 Tax=Asticcacaulis sp. TaxID=1872648 RepID=UPI0039E2E158
MTDVFLDDILKRIKAEKIEVIRLAFADQHGILRGKTIAAADLASVVKSGHSMTTSLLLKDTAHRTSFPIWRPDHPGMRDFAGAADMMMVPDLDTFRVLPWSPHSGWVLCDLIFQDGRPVPMSTRRIAQEAVEDLEHLGFDYLCGLEVEFHVFKLDDAALKPVVGNAQPGPPPEVSLLAHGFQYLTEQRFDQLEPVMDLIRRTCQALELPVRSFEIEMGPSQFEVTFHPMKGIAHADNMVLFRNAVKQVCRRHGYHATFMCRPRLPNCLSSGWHLHQSLVDRSTGANAFIPEREGEILSPVGQAFAAGILAHARETSLFSTPTINGYKRYAPQSLAPDRVVWGRDNRGAMLRVIGGFGNPATRIENRIGEPAANPYLYLAAQIRAGMDGLKRNLSPGPISENPYDAAAPRLPTSLMEAIVLARNSDFLTEAFGVDFVEYLLTIKEAEIARYLADLSDWEQREYFDIF